MCKAHLFYGGLCGGTERCAGSFVAGYANPAQFTTNRLASVVVINLTTKVITMTANVTPSVFHFESEATIRAIVIDGNPWFVAKDVIKALQLTNPTMSIKSLDDDERAKFNLGRQGETNIINESGLYTLILRCRDAVTPGTIPYRFRKWVTGEVLPQIRRTGSYIKNSLPQEERIKMVADQVANATASAVMQAMKIENQNLQRPTEARLPQPDSFSVWCSRPDGELTADESAEPVTGRRARRIGRSGGADHHVLLHRRCEQMPA